MGAADGRPISGARGHGTIVAADRFADGATSWSRRGRTGRSRVGPRHRWSCGRRPGEPSAERSARHERAERRSGDSRRRRRSGSARRPARDAARPRGPRQLRRVQPGRVDSSSPRAETTTSRSGTSRAARWCIARGGHPAPSPTRASAPTGGGSSRRARSRRSLERADGRARQLPLRPEAARDGASRSSRTRETIVTREEGGVVRRYGCELCGTVEELARIARASPRAGRAGADRRRSGRATSVDRRRTASVGSPSAASFRSARRRRRRGRPGPGRG